MKRLLKWVNNMLHKEISKTYDTVEYWAEIEGVKQFQDPNKKYKYPYASEYRKYMKT